MQHRLHVQRGSQQGGGGADPSPALKIFQIVHRKPVAQMKFVFLQRIRVLIQAHSLIPVLRGQIDKQPFPRGGAQGIHHPDSALRIFPAQLLRHLPAGLTGDAQSAGKGNIEHILPPLQNGCKRLHIGGFIDAGRLGHAAAPHLVIECLDGLVSLQMLLAVILKQKRHPDQAYPPLRQLFLRNVACRIRYNPVHRTILHPSLCRHPCMMEQCTSGANTSILI